MQGVTVDGNDVEAVFEAASEAADGVRRTRKPFLLETYTYRTRGHYEQDYQSYVDPAELAEWKTRDPILTARKRLTERGLTEDQLNDLQNGVLGRIQQAAAFANESPYPSPEQVLTDVFA
jgi:pyruvate dehydrogenase E1 component alpha subunit